MQLIKHTIRAVFGITICYTLLNLRVEGDYLKWDAFRFYTPEGTVTDSEGYTYFDVPADEVQLDRDTILDKTINVVVSATGGVEAFVVLEGATPTPINLGLAGDIIATTFIPSDTTMEIVVNYKEVLADG